jgi:hypothetical protein
LKKPIATRLDTYRPFTSHNKAALPVTPRLAESKVSGSDRGRLRLENHTHFIWPIPSLTENNTQALDRVLSQETRELSEMSLQLGCLCPSYCARIITMEMIKTADTRIPATSQTHGLRNASADHSFPSLCVVGSGSSWLSSWYCGTAWYVSARCGWGLGEVVGVGSGIGRRNCAIVQL